jgi:hypothetical protein
MNQEQRVPDKILHVGGREFRIYKHHDEFDDQEVLNYPDFQENPEYTDEGRPFVRVVDDACERWKPDDEKSARMEGCGGCEWLFLEHDPDAIGICMCEELRLAENKNKSEEEPK